MQEFFNNMKLIFDFLDDTAVLGMSLTTWIIIVLIISAISIFIRGNK